MRMVGFLEEGLGGTIFIVVVGKLSNAKWFDIKMHYAKSRKLLSCGEFKIMRIRNYEN